MEIDRSHLSALETRLSQERLRLTMDPACEIRKVWIAQIEKEIAAEKKFLGIVDGPEVALSDDELLRELLA